MGAGIKREREDEPACLSLALSLSTDSSTTTSMDSAGGVTRKKARRGRVVATSGEGDFVCKTCGRAFTSYQALGGHRTSHLRGRHGLELGVGVVKAIRDRKRLEDKDKQRHECHICGLGFETGLALGGHMRRHREEMAALGGVGDEGQWGIIAVQDQEMVGGHAADRPPVLLELFV